MATGKITFNGLGSTSSLNNTDIIPVWQNSESKKITYADFLADTVSKSGDTMSGNLTVDKNGAQIAVDTDASGATTGFLINENGTLKGFALYNTSENDFKIGNQVGGSNLRFNDDGSVKLDSNLTIEKDSAALNLKTVTGGTSPKLLLSEDTTERGRINYVTPTNSLNIQNSTVGTTLFMPDSGGIEANGNLTIKKSTPILKLDATGTTPSLVSWCESGTERAVITYSPTLNLLRINNKPAASYIDLLDSGGIETNGNLTIEKNSATINIDTNLATPGRLGFKENGVDKAYVLYNSANNRFQIGNITSGNVIYMYNSGGIETNADILPSTTETYDLGSPTKEWDNLYVQNSPTVSDERRKRDIVDEELGLDFINKLRPVQFVYKDNIQEAVTKEVTKEVQATETKEIEEKYIDIVDGQPIQRTRTKEVEIPLFDEVEVRDEQGNVVMESYEDTEKTVEVIQVADEENPMLLVDKEVAKYNKVTKEKPLTHKVPRMKTLTETVEVSPAVNITHSRPHSGLIAQEVEALVKQEGIDHAMFSYDEPTDRYFLRYQELIGVLIKAVQDLSTEIKTLKEEK